MNTRLQVEHTVTEMVTGLDLVALQIAVAQGERLDHLDPQPRGHAIQCRINAEDPGRNFLPGPGTHHPLPRARRARSCAWTRASREGGEIPGDYDSMFAKLIVFGRGPRAGAAADAPGAGRVPGRGRAHDDPGAPLDPGLEGVHGRARTRPRGSNARWSTPTCPAQVDLQPAAAGPAAGAARRHPRRGRRAPGAGPDLRRAARRGAEAPGRRTTRTTAGTCTA